MGCGVALPLYLYLCLSIYLGTYLLFVGASGRGCGSFLVSIDSIPVIRLVSYDHDGPGGAKHMQSPRVWGGK